MAFRTVFLLTFTACLFFAYQTLATSFLGECSEAICGPRVSKCMLIKSCNCSITPQDIKHKNCTCCKDCIKCLGELFSDCCSCVGLCRPTKDLDPQLAMHSYIGGLDPDEDEQDLFSEFTTIDLDPEKNHAWTIDTFPALEDPFFYKSRSDNETDKSFREKLLKLYENVNCTVIYLNECLSHKKCHTACQTMGASSFRWFHTGCCECVGNDCISYGSRENKCKMCQELEQLQVLSSQKRQKSAEL